MKPSISSTEFVTFADQLVAIIERLPAALDHFGDIPLVMDHVHQQAASPTFQEIAQADPTLYHTASARVLAIAERLVSRVKTVGDFQLALDVIANACDVIADRIQEASVS